MKSWTQKSRISKLPAIHHDEHTENKRLFGHSSTERAQTANYCPENDTDAFERTDPTNEKNRPHPTADA